MYLRISSQETPPTASSRRASSAALSSHPSHVGSSVTPSRLMVLGRNRGSMIFSNLPGGKSVREKKYGWGSESGETQAAAALPPASGEPRFPRSEEHTSELQSRLHL